MCKPIGLVVLLCASIVSAQTQNAAKPNATQPAGPPSAPSRVTAVTVYQGSALITRQVAVPNGVGLMELVVDQMPAQTIDMSLYGEGGEGLRILSTQFRTRAVKEDTRAEVRAAEDDLKKLESDTEKLDGLMQTAKANQQFAGKLEQFTTATMSSLMEKGMFNGDATIALSKFVMTVRGEQDAREVELKQQVAANHEAIDFDQRKLAELTAGSSRTVRDAVIVIDKTVGEAASIKLNYLVSDANWKPQYKLRAGSEKDPVQLEYLAAIEQQSGEDWTGVDVVLSTAEPMLNAAPPDLVMLEVTSERGAANQPAQIQPKDNLAQALQMRKQAAKEYTSNNGYNGGQFMNSAAAMEQTDELLNPDVQAQNGPDKIQLAQRRDGQSVTYHLKTKLTIPSRSDEQFIEVTRIEMTPDYFYKAVPVLTPHVYRLANLTNKSEIVLLPGDATMYVGSDFVGRMSLPLVAIGEQFTAGFGVDPQLQVDRELVDKNNTVQGGNQVHDFSYRLRVSSYKSAPVQLQLWDRLPHAEAEAVGVTLVKTSTDLSKDETYIRADRPENLLRWDLTVDPGMTAEKAVTITYEFKMEYARDVSIGNFKAAASK